MSEEEDYEYEYSDDDAGYEYESGDDDVEMKAAEMGARESNASGEVEPIGL